MAIPASGNLTLKKVRKMVMARCEWGHDNYSMNVANLPIATPDSGGASDERREEGPSGRANHGSFR
jgi:adenine-specific DNA-methyltransferase